MNPHATFYTDANSFGYIQRKAQTSEKQDIGARFFPVTSAIINGAQNKWFTVMTDRSMAGSVQHGRTELLINRKLSHKDKGGIDEKLDEPGPNRSGYVV